MSTLHGPRTCRTCIIQWNALQAAWVLPTCPVCLGERWVCEDHPDIPWGEGTGCCGGAGMPCLACNTGVVPEYPPGSIEVWRAY